MSLIQHHDSDPRCGLCSIKALLAHPDLQKWFWDTKLEYPDIHISWTYRDEKDQTRAFVEGKSKLVFPKSAHNKNPSHAVDLFQLDDSGKAVWDPVAMARIARRSIDKGYQIKWGGDFKSIGDFDHFEIT